MTNDDGDDYDKFRQHKKWTDNKNKSLLTCNVMRSDTVATFCMNHLL